MKKKLGFCSQIIFDNQLLGPVPEEGVPRLVTQRSNTRKDHMVRYGLAFQLSHGFMTTERGRQSYVNNLLQIRNATLDTLYMGIIRAYLYCKTVGRRLVELYGNAPTAGIIRRVMAEELEQWCCVNKSQNAFQLLDLRLKRRIRKAGAEADLWIIPEGMKHYLSNVRRENSDYMIKGPEGPQMFQSGLTDNALMLDKVLDCTILEARTLDLPEQSEPVDMLSRTQSIGEYFTMQNHLAHIDWKTYSTRMRDILVYNEEKDSWTQIGLEQMLDNCMVFDHSPGDGYSRKRKTDASATTPPTMMGPADETDFFSCDNGDGSCRPAEYLGDLRENALDKRAVQDFVACMVERINDRAGNTNVRNEIEELVSGDGRDPSSLKIVLEVLKSAAGNSVFLDGTYDPTGENNGDNTLFHNLIKPIKKARVSRKISTYTPVFKINDDPKIDEHVEKKIKIHNIVSTYENINAVFDDFAKVMVMDTVESAPNEEIQFLRKLFDLITKEMDVMAVAGPLMKDICYFRCYIDSNKINMIDFHKSANEVIKMLNFGEFSKIFKQYLKTDKTVSYGDYYKSVQKEFMTKIKEIVEDGEEEDEEEEDRMSTFSYSRFDPDYTTVAGYGMGHGSAEARGAGYQFIEKGILRNIPEDESHKTTRERYYTTIGNQADLNSVTRPFSQTFKDRFKEFASSVNSPSELHRIIAQVFLGIPLTLENLKRILHADAPFPFGFIGLRCVISPLPFPSPRADKHNTVGARAQSLYDVPRGFGHPYQSGRIDRKYDDRPCKLHAWRRRCAKGTTKFALLCVINPTLTRTHGTGAYRQLQHALEVGGVEAPPSGHCGEHFRARICRWERLHVLHKQAAARRKHEYDDFALNLLVPGAVRINAAAYRRLLGDASGFPQPDVDYGHVCGRARDAPVPQHAQHDDALSHGGLV